MACVMLGVFTGGYYPADVLGLMQCVPGRLVSPGWTGSDRDARFAVWLVGFRRTGRLIQSL